VVRLINEQRVNSQPDSGGLRAFEDSIHVIPGRLEEASPESRNSGSVLRIAPE